MATTSTIERGHDNDSDAIRNLDQSLQVEQIQVAQEYENATTTVERRNSLDRLVDIVELRNQLQGSL